MPAKQSFLIMTEEPHVAAYLDGLARNHFGHNAEHANSCIDAIHKLEQRSYAVLLLDMWMSNGDGETVLDWVRAEEREEPVIMMCEGGDYDLWLDLLNKGATDLVSKPIQPSEMKRVIRWALNLQERPNIVSPPKRASKLHSSKSEGMSAAEQLAYRISGIHERIMQLRGSIRQVQNDLEGTQTSTARTGELRQGISNLRHELENISKQLQFIEMHRKSLPSSVFTPVYGYRLTSPKRGLDKRRSYINGIQTDRMVPTEIGKQHEIAHRSTA